MGDDKFLWEIHNMFWPCKSSKKSCAEKTYLNVIQNSRWVHFTPEPILHRPVSNALLAWLKKYHSHLDSAEGKHLIPVLVKATWHS